MLYSIRETRSYLESVRLERCCKQFLSGAADQETKLVGRDGEERDYRAMDGGVGDSSADETNNLVLSEDHSSPSRAKKYMVSGGVPSKKKWFSRNEWICMAVGVVVVVMGLMVVLGLGVGLGLRNSGNASNSGSSPWRNVRLPSAITPEGLSLSPPTETRTHLLQ